MTLTLLWLHTRLLTLQDPQKNRYVAHMHCIRWIQDYLVRKVRGLTLWSSRHPCLFLMLINHPSHVQCKIRKCLRQIHKQR